MKLLFALILLLALSACSPMPGKYGFINGVEREHSLEEMTIDIKTGNIFWVSWQCNKEDWRQGDGLSTILWFPFTLGLRGGCIWVGGYSPGKIDFCHGYSTPYQLEHEKLHCRGYADHLLLRF
ncbi:MAG: hypothetical protein KA768_08170 [Desulfobulbus sp.]|nr:hypothetical protein [Desulfobulbus sp.]